MFSGRDPALDKASPDSSGGWGSGSEDLPGTACRAALRLPEAAKCFHANAVVVLGMLAAFQSPVRSSLYSCSCGYQHLVMKEH